MNCPFCNKELTLGIDGLNYHSFESKVYSHFYSIIIENDIIIEEFLSDDLSLIELLLVYKSNHYTLTQVDNISISGTIDGKSLMDIYNRIINLKVFS